MIPEKSTPQGQSPKIEHVVETKSAKEVINQARFVIFEFDPKNIPELANESTGQRDFIPGGGIELFSYVVSYKTAEPYFSGIHVIYDPIQTNGTNVSFEGNSHLRYFTERGLHPRISSIILPSANMHIWRSVDYDRPYDEMVQYKIDTFPTESHDNDAFVHVIEKLGLGGVFIGTTESLCTAAQNAGLDALRVSADGQLTLNNQILEGISLQKIAEQLENG